MSLCVFAAAAGGGKCAVEVRGGVGPGVQRVADATLAELTRLIEQATGRPAPQLRFGARVLRDPSARLSDLSISAQAVIEVGSEEKVMIIPAQGHTGYDPIEATDSLTVEAW
eukprot:gene20583-19568_t